MRKTVEDYVGTEVVLHRKTRRAAQAYVDRWADATGDVTIWNGAESLPVHLTFHVAPAATGGFDVVRTITARDDS